MQEIIEKCEYCGVYGHNSCSLYGQIKKNSEYCNDYFIYYFDQFNTEESVKCEIDRVGQVRSYLVREKSIIHLLTYIYGDRFKNAIIEPSIIDKYYDYANNNYSFWKLYEEIRNQFRIIRYNESDLHELNKLENIICENCENVHKIIELIYKIYTFRLKRENNFAETLIKNNLPNDNYINILNYRISELYKIYSNILECKKKQNDKHQHLKKAKTKLQEAMNYANYIVNDDIGPPLATEVMILDK